LSRAPQVEDVLAGQVKAIARLIRDIDDQSPRVQETLKQLYPHTGRAYLVGLTGSPGVGKSSLVDQLISRFRRQGLKVGVVAVDPTSPFSGGALLGDRIRMQHHATDPGVFIRSLATRGAFGGLTPSAPAVVQVLDAAGFERILIETVGVGQDEVDIVRLAHTTLVLTVPGLGDGIQAIKAGILEIADLLLVNKADQPGAERTLKELQGMLELNRLSGQEKAWWPGLLAVSARTGQGLDELDKALESHRRFLEEERPDLLAARTRLQVKELVLNLVQDRAKVRAERRLEGSPDWTSRLEEVVARRKDPYSLAEEILKEEFG